LISHYPFKGCGGQMKRLLICFGAGSLGGLVNSLAIWACGKYGITAAMGVKIAPALTPEWLYPRIVWGGIWGLLFVPPLMNSRPMVKGLVMSIFPTLVQLLVVFPLQAKKGYLGLDLGSLTPLFVVVFNIVWGVVTALAVRRSK
jgi:hypothetical protein